MKYHIVLNNPMYILGFNRMNNIHGFFLAKMCPDMKFRTLLYIKYQHHLYTDCTKTLTAPKHRPH